MFWKTICIAKMIHEAETPSTFMLPIRTPPNDALIECFRRQESKPFDVPVHAISGLNEIFSQQHPFEVKSGRIESHYYRFDWRCRANPCCEMFAEQ